MGYRIQGAGCRWSARRASDAASIREIVRKHDCALLTLYPKHSNARGAIVMGIIRVRVRREFFNVVVFVTSRGYRQTNFSQTLKETNRFTFSIPQIHLRSQGCDDHIDVLGSPGDMFRDRFIDLDLV